MKKQLVIKKISINEDTFIIIRKCNNGLYQFRWKIDGEGVTMHFKKLQEAFNEYYDFIRMMTLTAVQ